ncbi:adhesion G-protein coupled receptor F3 [Triplophysa rosa]|uniref:G-protein coupled receptor 116 n=1 Tax=Triplophysa rosa TaxID=992332 RepID=A0A9W7WJP2_TRIRA|nr:adhesion G-protein coupled receptor F3 [Triplophysa rosa]KAI7799803.1 putative G-protein coupled receptor 116 [Triplophysa rosa]
MRVQRVKKLSDASMLFFAALFILSQTSNVGSTDVTYWAEVMIEGNKTLNVASLLPDMQGPLDTTGVTITNAEIAAECEIIGRNTTCWCGVNYVWSNFVCDTVNKCCNVEKCVANVSDFTPLCLPKVNVSLFGTVTGSATVLPITIDPSFRVLNAFNSLVTTGSILTGLNTYQHNFTVSLSSVFSTAKVQSIIAALLTDPTFYTLTVRSLGMVHIEAPSGKLCYNSRQQLNCTCMERMDTCVWQMTRGDEFPLTLGPGSEVTLADLCTEQSTVTLLKTNGFWSGTYGCLFISGNIAHTALAPIEIALLPEVINVTATPPSADCSAGASTMVSISCTIENSTETYSARLKVGLQENSAPTKEELNGIIKYTAEFSVDCMVATKPRSYDGSCTLENTMSQQRNRTIKIPVIYPGDAFCAEEVIENRMWPKTKDNETAVLDCTLSGRQGTFKRKCTGSKWGEEISMCVKAILNIVSLQAADFEKGLGATQEIASLIFESLRNNTSEESDNTFGDVKATVSVFQTMKSASANIRLGENLLPNFIESASSMLNATWDIGDEEETGALATQYLSSVEGLVQSIRINNSDGYNSSKIQLQICRAGSSCNKTVFNVDVGLNATADMVKTVGLQSLANRLPKDGYEGAIFPSIVVSTQVENMSSSTANIKLAFQNDETGTGAMHCVFWNFTEQRWSSDGCEYVKGPGGMGTCECNHLTSFSMLMSKHTVSMPFLDQLTYIGLGVSICSLIAYIIIEVLVWKAVVKSSLSHFRHTALINISLCLLLADCSFLASSFPSILNDTLCLVLVIAKHYFFLAMFFWMLCLSVMLVYQLIFVFSHIGKKVYMIIGFTIGYICPTITVAVTYVYYDQATDVPYYSTKTCWLTYQSAMVGSIHAFLFPVGTIVLVNLFSMGMVIATVLKPSGAEANNKKADKEAAKAVMKVIMFLTPVFGGTWVLGLFVFLLDDFTQFTTIFVHYAFTIVNSLQGFFILLTGCFAEKRVRDEILRIVMGKSAKDSGK